MWVVHSGDCRGECLTGAPRHSPSADAHRLARARSFITQGLEARHLWPVIDASFPFEQIADAHRYIESNRQFGKVVVTVTTA
ncbi:zinc-binding dehydrogenase [Methylibium sp.]|uniref:zinc-binding dehydrogenase n=1 Tax=Methylibium sp. TaxID=2067992 RepID=UPI00286CB321|nr:zinc-binding dehydrogenase [Methylibium sp.]